MRARRAAGLVPGSSVAVTTLNGAGVTRCTCFASCFVELVELAADADLIAKSFPFRLPRR
jgi:hypothetical protein